MEDWADICRLCRRGFRRQRLPGGWQCRGTVARAVAAETPPRYRRAPKGLAVDALEPAIRCGLTEFPDMPATVIAERIGWDRSLTVLKDRVRVLRPLFVPVDPHDRAAYAPGQVVRCDLWFPPCPIPRGAGRARVLPVLVMTCGYSRVSGAVMIPSRRGGDILAGMWAILTAWGRCLRTLVWTGCCWLPRGRRLSRSRRDDDGETWAGVRAGDR